jgi:hypothetical protein
MGSEIKNHCSALPSAALSQAAALSRTAHLFDLCLPSSSPGNCNYKISFCVAKVFHDSFQYNWFIYTDIVCVSVTKPEMAIPYILGVVTGLMTEWLRNQGSTSCRAKKFHLVFSVYDGLGVLPASYLIATGASMEEMYIRYLTTDILSRSDHIQSNGTVTHEWREREYFVACRSVARRLPRDRRLYSCRF